MADCADLGQLSLVSALTACQLDAAGDTLVIRVPDHRDTRVLLEKGEQYESMVAGALTAHLGHEQPVSIIPADAAARRGRYRQAESHPLVQQLMDQFQAEILAFEPLNRNAWEQHLGSPGDATQPDSN